MTSEFKYHSEIRITDHNPDLPFELALDFELENLDISLVNGLRRVILAEVPTVSISPDIELDVDRNITVFNSQYLKDRLSMQPIHLQSIDDMFQFREPKMVFRIADPDNWDQPLVNPNNANFDVTIKDLIVLIEDDTGVLPKVEEEEDEEVDDTSPITVAAQLAEEKFIASATAQEDLLAGDAPGSPPETQSPVSDKNYRRGDPSDFFTYMDMYLLTLKRGESLYSSMKPQIGTGQTHARWQSALVSYKFKPQNPELLQTPDSWDESYDPLKERQNYPVSPDLPGEYGTPKTFQLSIEYNGHYRPALAWSLSIRTLHRKLVQFQTEVRQITGESGKVTDNLSVMFSPKNMIPNEVVLTLTDQDHTLGNIVFSHFLYLMQEMVKKLYPDTYDVEILQGLSSYRIPNPLKNEMIIRLKLPDWSQVTFNQGFAHILRAGDNPYDDIFYQSVPTLRLLMIMLERVIATLDEVQQEAEKILAMVESGDVSVQQTQTKLPQAPLRKTKDQMEDATYSADIQLEERSIIGVEEEAVEGE